MTTEPIRTQVHFHDYFTGNSLVKFQFENKFELQQARFLVALSSSCVYDLSPRQEGSVQIQNESNERPKIRKGFIFKTI
jgi:hypothetical protein